MSNYYHRRMEGYLPKLKGNVIPKRYIFLDTETTSPSKTNNINEFTFILGVLIFVELNKDLTTKRREVNTFNSTDEFIDIVESYIRGGTVVYLYAHNIGFDVRVLDLPYHLNERGYVSEPPIINETAFIWRNRSQNGSMLFLDTRNLGVDNVASLGKDMGFPKWEIDFETCSREYLRDYCENDCAVLEKFVLAYIRYVADNALGSLKTTLASQAMSAYRTKFMNIQPCIHNNKDVIELERKSYHGGRVECFKLGLQPKQNYFILDVNSMYPYAMLGSKLPMCLEGVSYYCSLSMLKLRMQYYYVIADVTLKTNEPVYPILKGDKLIFPTGEFRTVLSHPELEYAVEHNHIAEIHKTAQYKQGSLFDAYVNFFYDEKVRYGLMGDTTHRYIIKKFLNALYGKWGQQQPHREQLKDSDYKGVTRLPIYNTETGLHSQEINWYGHVYREYKEGETSFSCPYIASAITAKARMLLWLYVKCASKENVLYVDTDSLIVNARGYRRLLIYCDETAIGNLKLEAQSQYLSIQGNKDYQFGTQVKHKGLPTKANKITQNQWEYLEFEGFIRWMNRGAKGSPKGQFKLKSRKSVYNKGIIVNEKTVIPFILFPQEHQRTNKSFDLAVQ